jgi:hypothetical protein
MPSQPLHFPSERETIVARQLTFTSQGSTDAAESGLGHRARAEFHRPRPPSKSSQNLPRLSAIDCRSVCWSQNRFWEPHGKIAHAHLCPCVFFPTEGIESFALILQEIFHPCLPMLACAQIKNKFWEQKVAGSNPAAPTIYRLLISTMSMCVTDLVLWKAP